MDVFHRIFGNFRDVYDMYKIYCIVLQCIVLIPEYHLFSALKIHVHFSFPLMFPVLRFHELYCLNKFSKAKEICKCVKFEEL